MSSCRATNAKATETKADDACPRCENKWCDGTDCRPGQHVKHGGLIVSTKRYYGSIGNP